jgi:hypothetical protein
MQDMSAMEDSDEKDRSSTAPSFSGYPPPSESHTAAAFLFWLAKMR